MATSCLKDTAFWQQMSWHTFESSGGTALFFSCHHPPAPARGFPNMDTSAFDAFTSLRVGTRKETSYLLLPGDTDKGEHGE